MAKALKKRNPTDATMRNIRALKKDVRDLKVNLRTVAKAVEKIRKNYGW